MPHDRATRRVLPSREMSLLLACAASQTCRRGDDQIRDLLAAPIDWPAFVALAKHHRVVALLYAALGHAHSQSVPISVLAELRDAYQAGARQSLFLTGQLKQLLQFLESKGIPAIPFKGPLLAFEAYGDLALRGSGDLDLLVHRRDILRARQLLISRGCAPIFPTATPRQAAYLRSLSGPAEHAYVQCHAEHHLLSSDGRVNIDLHWAIALSEFALPLDCRRIWDNVRSVPFAGGEVRGLGEEDLLLTLCVNGAKDGWRRLDRLCDVAALLSRQPLTNWISFLSRACAVGAERIVLLTLLLAQDLLQVPVPPAPAKHIAGQAPLRPLSDAIQANLFRALPNHPNESKTFQYALFQLRVRDRLRDKIRYLLAQSAPTVGDWAALPLPKGLHFLYYLLRPIRLLTRADAVRG